MYIYIYIYTGCARLIVIRIGLEYTHMCRLIDWDWDAYVIYRSTTEILSIWKYLEADLMRFTDIFVFCIIL